LLSVVAALTRHRKGAKRLARLVVREGRVLAALVGLELGEGVALLSVESVDAVAASTRRTRRFPEPDTLEETVQPQEASEADDALSSPPDEGDERPPEKRLSKGKSQLSSKHQGEREESAYRVVDDAGDEEEDDEDDVAVVKKLVITRPDRLERGGGEDSQKTPSLQEERAKLASTTRRRKRENRMHVRQRRRRTCTTARSEPAPSFRTDRGRERVARTSQWHERSRTPR
jgi:hypothetical protein